MRNKHGQFTKGHPVHPNLLKALCKPKEERKCQHCGIPFKVLVSSNRISCGAVCGNKIASKKRVKEVHKPYINNGYWRVVTASGKRVYVHKLVAETKVGRKLLPNEQVHHINRNKFDNRPENLLVIDNIHHQMKHVKEDKAQLVCASCGKSFMAMAKRHLKVRYCSTKCCKRAIRARNKNKN